MGFNSFYSSDEGQPYKPLNDDEKGPFFSCDKQDSAPHFHAVTEHPNVDDASEFAIRQLHVPGYDQHSGNIRTNFASSPPFNIVTGWHIAHPETNSHLSEFTTTKKYANTTDGDEALGLWKDECTGTYGPGAFIKRTPLNTTGPDDQIHEFLPGKEQPEEQPEEQQQQQQQQEQPQQEQEEQQQAPANQVPLGLKPGEKAHSIVFYPPKTMGDTIRPAFSRAKVYEGHNNSSEAQGKLLTYADKLDMINILHDYKKQQENPDIWEDLFKRSKKNTEWY